MALRTARSTVDQRLALAKVRDDLQQAFDALPGRFWAARSQREAYTIVLAHLTAWADWEAI